MRLRRGRQQRGWDVNIAPLIDVVFLLIIFSMTVSHFTRMQAENLVLPEAQEGESYHAPRPHRLLINVMEDGQVIIAGRQHTKASLGALLDRASASNGDTPLTVLIRGDRGAPWRSVAGVMVACAARHISHVHVGVIPPQ